MSSPDLKSSNIKSNIPVLTMEINYNFRDLLKTQIPMTSLIYDAKSLTETTYCGTLKDSGFKYGYTLPFNLNDITDCHAVSFGTQAYNKNTAHPRPNALIPVNKAYPCFVNPDRLKISWLLMAKQAHQTRPNYKINLAKMFTILNPASQPHCQFSPKTGAIGSCESLTPLAIASVAKKLLNNSDNFYVGTKEKRRICRLPLLELCSIKHSYRGDYCIFDPDYAKDHYVNSLHEETVESLLIEFIDKEISDPRCGYTFEGQLTAISDLKERDLEWSKMFTHEKLSDDDKIVIKFISFDEKYYQNYGKMLESAYSQHPDLASIVKSKNCVSIFNEQKMSERKPYLTAQTNLDNVLKKLAELEKDGIYYSSSKKTLYNITELKEILAHMNSLFKIDLEKLTIVWMLKNIKIHIMKPTLEILIKIAKRRQYTDTILEIIPFADGIDDIELAKELLL